MYLAVTCNKHRIVSKSSVTFYQCQKCWLCAVKETEKMAAVFLLPGPGLLRTSNDPSRTVVGVDPEYQTGPRSAFKNRMVRNLCIVQIILGLSSIVFGIVLLTRRTDEYILRTGAGIWCGMVFLATGVIGVATTKTRNGRETGNTAIVLLLLMCVLSALLCIPLLLLSVLNTGAWCWGSSDVTSKLRICQNNADLLTKAMNMCLISIAAMEAIVSSWCAYLCCRASCCKPEQSAIKENRGKPLQVYYTSAPPPWQNGKPSPQAAQSYHEKHGGRAMYNDQKNQGPVYNNQYPSYTQSKPQNPDVQMYYSKQMPRSYYENQDSYQFPTGHTHVKYWASLRIWHELKAKILSFL